MSEIVIVGLNHKTAPVEVRERLAFPADTVGHALRGLRERDGISEAVILSTCNRVEVYARSETGLRACEHVTDFLAALPRRPDSASCRDHLYHHHGRRGGAPPLPRRRAASTRWWSASRRSSGR